MAKYNTKLQEEELKLHIAEDWFAAYDCKRKIGKIDFCVDIPATELGLYDATSALWAEAKAGTSKDIRESFVQLILTIGRSKTFTANQPPFFLGAFDAEKIAFLPYDAVMDVFAQNDFNWNVTPSDHATKEFKQLYEIARQTLEEKSLIYNYETDEKELHKFIKENFVTGRKDVSRIQITRNNFPHVYQKWRTEVMPSLDVENWDALRKSGIIDADFFLADILSENNKTLRKKLFVLLQSDIYEVNFGNADNGLELISRVGFNDGQKAHTRFWNRYTRPPRKDYWDFIVERRDLLVDQDVRERKGAFFTPRPWVELSQEYLAKELGENWQDDHYIWDCCGGTGNLEAGLTNKYNIWVSTLDKADVDVMHTRIKMMNEQVKGGANLLDTHVFKFDFLNDSFDKLPQGLKEIIDDPEKRKKLVIYINPPYAEAGNARQLYGTGENKNSVATDNATYLKYKVKLGKAANEMFAQFLARIFSELAGCKVGNFSTLKVLQSPNFEVFRKNFPVMLRSIFLVPGFTFDNVKGPFPIGFFIWDSAENIPFEEIKADVFGADGELRLEKKTLFAIANQRMLSKFAPSDKSGKAIAHFAARGNDFQNQNVVYIANVELEHKGGGLHCLVTRNNLLRVAISYAVHWCIPANWVNNQDQFLYPNDGWETDSEFILDCLVYTIFHRKNRISTQYGPNHWIPFTESEVGAKDCFTSHFMSDFIAGKVETESQGDLFAEAASSSRKPIDFSTAARAVLDAGRELWEYYHAQPNANPNASYYDIRAHFQGRKPNGTMNATSDDAQYNALLDALKKTHKTLAAQIAPKVYAYGFLRA